MKNFLLKLIMTYSNLVNCTFYERNWNTYLFVWLILPVAYACLKDEARYV